MKKIILILMIILLLPININCQEEKMDQGSQYGIVLSTDKGIYQGGENLSTDKGIYQGGEKITIKIKLFNY
jgi:hypothetical protein